MIKNKPTSKRTALGMAVAAALPAVSLAQGDIKELPTAKAQGETEETYKIDDSSLRQLTQPIADTPRSISVIPQAVIQDQGLTNLNDALRNVSGVSTFGGGEGGGGVISTADSLSIRGFDATNSIFVDGLRDVAGYSRDLFNSENIEVSKGSDGAIFGRSTGGGAVNLGTKRAKLDDFGSAEASYDEFDTKRLSLDTNKQFSDTVAGRLNILYSDGGDTFDNGVENYETKAAAASVLFQVSDATRVNVDAMIMDQDNVPLLGLPYIRDDAAGEFVPGEPYTITNADGTTTTVTNPAQFSPTDSFGTGGTGLPAGMLPENLWDNYYGVRGRDLETVDVKMLTVAVDHEFSANLSFRNQTRYATNERKITVGRPVLRNTFTGPRPPRSSGIRPVNYGAARVSLDRLQGIDEEFSLAVNQTDLFFSFDNSSVSQDIVVGLELAKEERDNYFLNPFGSFFGESSFDYIVDGEATQTPNVDLFNPSRDISFTGGLRRTGQAEQTEGTTVSLYAFDTVKFGEQWQLDLNARYEDFTLEGSRCSGRGRCTVEDDLEVSETFFSYGAGLSYKINDQGNVYVSFANSQQPVGINLDLQSADTNKLEPQEAESIEVGSKWQLLDERLLLTAAYYQTTKTVLDSEGRGQPLVLAGEQEAKGFELGLAGSVSDALSVNFTYTHLDTEITQDFNEDSVGDGLQASPEDTASLSLNYSLMNDDLKLGGGATYSSGNVFWRRNTAYFETGSYTEFWLMAQYQLNQNVSVQLNANNLTDEQYATDYSAWGHFRPNDPRNLKLAVRYTF